MKLIQPSHTILEQPSGLEGIYKMIEIAGRTCYKSEDKITEDSAKKFVDMLIARGHTAMLEHGTVYLTFESPCQKQDYFPVHNYISNPYSKVNSEGEEWTGWERTYYITTNMRVLYENGWLNDLEYICEPTKYHEKRVTVKFITDRGVSHELVRHRVFSFAQESTRYCNYSKDKFGSELTFIIPSWLPDIEEYIENYGLPGTDEPIVRPSEDSDEYKYYLFGYALSYAEEHYLDLINIGVTPQQARQVLPNATKTEIVMTGFISDWIKVFLQRVDGTTGKPHPDMKALMEPVKEEFIKRGLV